jgi:hypothetical protein
MGAIAEIVEAALYLVTAGFVTGENSACRRRRSRRSLVRVGSEPAYGIRRYK